MIEIIPYSQVEKKYLGKGVLKQDACRKRTVAIVYNGATMIPLCEDCLKRMNKEMESIVGEIEQKNVG